jgi:hypothetical protein
MYKKQVKDLGKNNNINVKKKAIENGILLSLC